MHKQSMISGTGEVAVGMKWGKVSPSVCLIGGRLAKKIARSVPTQWGLQQHTATEVEHWHETIQAHYLFHSPSQRLHVYSLRYDHVPWTCCARLLMCVLLLFACLSSLVFVLWLLLGRSPEWIRAACSSSFHLDLFKSSLQQVPIDSLPLGTPLTVFAHRLTVGPFCPLLLP